MSFVSHLSSKSIFLCPKTQLFFHLPLFFNNNIYLCVRDTSLTNRCIDLCNISPLKLVEMSHCGIFECIHVDTFKMLHSVLHEQVVFLFMNVLILPNCL